MSRLKRSFIKIRLKFQSDSIGGGGREIENVSDRNFFKIFIIFLKKVASFFYFRMP